MADAKAGEPKKSQPFKSATGDNDMSCRAGSNPAHRTIGTYASK